MRPYRRLSARQVCALDLRQLVPSREQRDRPSRPSAHCLRPPRTTVPPASRRRRSPGRTAPCRSRPPLGWREHRRTRPGGKRPVSRPSLQVQPPPENRVPFAQVKVGPCGLQRRLLPGWLSLPALARAPTESHHNGTLPDRAGTGCGGWTAAAMRSPCNKTWPFPGVGGDSWPSRRLTLTARKRADDQAFLLAISGDRDRRRSGDLPLFQAASITKVDGSHVMMVSQPEVVVDVIVRAIAGVG